MRAAVFPAGVIVVLAGMLLVSPALAAGYNLRWDRCYGDGGTANRTFACDTNAGSEVLVCSFVLDAPRAQVSGNEIIIDVLSLEDPIPPWWHFRDPGSCRQNSMNLSLVANPADVTCVDWAAGKSEGGIGFYGAELGNIDPSLVNRHRKIKIALAVWPQDLADLMADTEYFSCNVTINHVKTVGPTACPGCAGPVCVVLTHLKVTTTDPGTDITLHAPTTPGSDIVTWQGIGPNCQLVPVKRSTWGAVKGLYR